MSISKYVEQKNRWNAIFGHPEYDLKNPADRQRIADMIDSDLSPENLTCDGELSAGQVRVRYAILMKAAQDLKALDPTVKFAEMI